VITIAAVLILGVGGWYVSSGDFTSTGNQTATVISADQTVATVNGERIFGADFNILQTQIVAERELELDTLNKQEKDQLQTQIMDMLISRILLQQAVLNSTDINITESEIAVQMEIIKSRFENEEAFNEALAAQGITKEALQTQVGYELATQEYLEQELNIPYVDVTEAAVNTLIEELKAEARIEILI
ncbi:MAG: SurA N-terminal domain-containing protein, partial [Parcubacteria group bacterium]